MCKSADIKEYNELRKALVWAGTRAQKSAIQAEMRVFESKYSLDELLGIELAAIYRKYNIIPSIRG